MKPSEEICNKTQTKIEEEIEKAQLLQTLKGKETVTLDGRKIHLYANIANVGDVGYVLENDAEGIGLFRSEFLYLGKTSFPTEEEQFQAYKQVAQMMAGKRSSSGHLISERINKWIIFIWDRRTIRRWDIVQSESA